MTIHALLIAINQYPPPVRALRGCINDRDVLLAFLENHCARRENLTLRSHLLTDGEATRDGIIAAFDHFTGAVDGDVCLFYFSGHGSRVPAPPEFRRLEPSGMIETLVAHDSRSPGRRDLTDKELSFLFWRATQGRRIHFLGIFDSCHSGTISKDASLTDRLTSPGDTPPGLDGFCGLDRYVRQLLDGQVTYTPPRGRIVQLSASSDRETAREGLIDGQIHGLFTHALLETLEQDGLHLSYAELLRTLRVRVNNRFTKQTPQLLATDPADKDLAFLGGALPPRPTYFTVRYRLDRWVLDAGLIQGIPAEGGTLELEDGRTITLRHINANESEVTGMAGKDTGRDYRAFARDIAFRRLPLAFDPQGDATAIAHLREAAGMLASIYFQLSNQTEGARYWIRTTDESLSLTLPGEVQPIFQPVAGHAVADATAFLQGVEQVARRHALLDLSNPRSALPADAIAIDLFRLFHPATLQDLNDETPAERVVPGDEPRFTQILEEEKWKYPAFRLRIRNTCGQRLYLAALYLSNTFSITDRFLPVTELGPGEEVWLTDVYKNIPYRTIPLSIPEAQRQKGLTEVTNFIKIIATTDPQLNVDFYRQPGLNVEPIKAKKGFLLDALARLQRPPQHAWRCWLVDLPICLVLPFRQDQASIDS